MQAHFPNSLRFLLAGPVFWKYFCKAVKKNSGEILRFGGFQKNSLIDYPGKVSCVVFVSGCNFHCPFCHNPELLNSALDRYPLADIIDFLGKRKKLLDAVVISGGEPTLQKDLLAFCEQIKFMGYALKVDTNGSRPQVLKALIQSGFVDYLAMDIKTLPHLYRPAISISVESETLLESIRLIMESDVDYEFRTTCAKPLVDQTVLLGLARMISGARRYVLQTFRSKEILSPGFFENAEAPFSTDELMGLKNILEKYVQECLVR
jgi:pyruvate formate lyase activating enzyme